MSDNPFASLDVVDTAQPLQGPPRRWRRILLYAFALAAIGLILIALLLPVTRRARPAALRTQCKNNLKQIGLALHNYHDDYGSLPPAYTVDSNGRMLHSWRTLILPYLEQEQLYRQIDLSKPVRISPRQDGLRRPSYGFAAHSFISKTASGSSQLAHAANG